LTAYGLSEMARRTLCYANRGLPRVDSLRKVAKVLLDFTGCDALEIRVKDPEMHYSWEASKQLRGSFRFTILGNSGIGRSPRNGGVWAAGNDILSALRQPATSIPFEIRSLEDEGCHVFVQRLQRSRVGIDHVA